MILIIHVKPSFFRKLRHNWLMNKLATNHQNQKAFVFPCLSEKPKITLYNRSRELSVYYVLFKLLAWKGRNAENGAYCLGYTWSWMRILRIDTEFTVTEFKPYHGHSTRLIELSNSFRNFLGRDKKQHNISGFQHNLLILRKFPSLVVLSICAYCISRKLRIYVIIRMILARIYSLCIYWRIILVANN